MNSPRATDSVTVDDVDRQILRCCQLAPRAPFARFAEVLGVSEQTVARRYRRLHRAGVVRIVGLVDAAALGQSNWVVRVQCKPAGAPALARALAQREDVGWVALSGGGAEITCAVRSRTAHAREDLLMQRLPQTAPVLGISAAVLLHSFAGGSADDWAGLDNALTAAQTAALGGVTPHQPREPGNAVLTAEDEALLDVLTVDGRAGYGALAAAAGISESRAARRLAQLLERRVAYVDVDLSARALGFQTQATLWLTVTPGRLDEVGRALGAAREVAFAAAITGPQNLTASVTCRDLESLYRFVTTVVGALPGVTALEVSTVLRHVKQAGTLVAGDRLADAATSRPAGR